MDYAFCVAGSVCSESTTHWRSLQTINSAGLCCLISVFRMLVRRWCLIKGFRIVLPMCGRSSSVTKRSEALMSAFMFVQTSCWTNSGGSNESKTHEIQIMLLLCNLSFRNWWHYRPCVRWNHWSPVDYRCKGSLECSFGGPVCNDSITKGGLEVFFHVSLNELLNKQHSCQWVEISCTRMRCNCFVSFVNSTFRMVEHQDNHVAVISQCTTRRG